VKQENYVKENGESKESYKVNWVNPWDYEGKLESASPEAIAKIGSLYGSQLRAVCGVKKAEPEKPAGRPSSPPPPPPSKPKKVTFPDATKSEAWTAFYRLIESNPKFDESFIADEWERIGLILFDKAFTADTLTPREWGRMMVEGPGLVIPF
jgi:hypothetical protein